MIKNFEKLKLFVFTILFILAVSSVSSVDSSSALADLPLNGSAPFNDNSPLSLSYSAPNGVTSGVNGVSKASGDWDTGEAVSIEADNNQYLESGTDSGLNSGTVSVSAWIKPESLPGTVHIVNRDDFNTGERSWTFPLKDGDTSDSDFEIGFNVQSSSGFNKAPAHGDIQAGNLYHVVATYDGSDVKYYVNNSLVGTETVNYGQISSSNAPVTIGAYGSASAGFYDGVIDNVKVYSGVINSTEVSNLYNYNSLNEPETFVDKSPTVSLDTNNGFVFGGSSVELNYTATDDLGLSKTELYSKQTWDYSNTSFFPEMPYPSTPEISTDINSVCGDQAVLSSSDVSDYGNVESVADPFSLPNPSENNTDVYFEVKNSNNNPTYAIGHATFNHSNVCDWDYQEIVIQNEEVTYPKTFIKNGSPWIVADGEGFSSDNNIPYYKGSSRSSFSKQGDIISNLDYIPKDFFLFEKSNTCFLFVGDTDNETTRVYQQPEAQNWCFQNYNGQEASYSPVNDAVSNGGDGLYRPGGRAILKDSGQVFMPYINSSAAPNRAVTLVNASVSTSSYSDTIVKKDVIKGDGDGWNADSMHHLEYSWGNYNQDLGDKWYAIVDGNPDGTNGNDISLGLYSGSYQGNWSSKLTDSNPVNGSNSFSDSFSDGQYLWNVEATDNSSQTSFASSNYSFSVSSSDTTPPSSSDNWTASGFVDKSSADVEITATDDNSGVANITYSLNGSTPTTVQGSSTVVSINQEGNTTLEYYATDNAGNVEASNTEYVALDSSIGPEFYIQNPSEGDVILASPQQESLTDAGVHADTTIEGLYLNQPQSGDIATSTSVPIKTDAVGTGGIDLYVNGSNTGQIASTPDDEVTIEAGGSQTLTVNGIEQTIEFVGPFADTDDNSIPLRVNGQLYDTFVGDRWNLQDADSGAESQDVQTSTFTRTEELFDRDDGQSLTLTNNDGSTSTVNIVNVYDTSMEYNIDGGSNQVISEGEYFTLGDWSVLNEVNTGVGGGDGVAGFAVQDYDQSVTVNAGYIDNEVFNHDFGSDGVYEIYLEGSTGITSNTEMFEVDTSETANVTFEGVVNSNTNGTVEGLLDSNQIFTEDHGGTGNESYSYWQEVEVGTSSHSLNFTTDGGDEYSSDPISFEVASGDSPVTQLDDPANNTNLEFGSNAVFNFTHQASTDFDSQDVTLEWYYDNSTFVDSANVGDVTAGFSQSFGVFPDDSVVRNKGSYYWQVTATFGGSTHVSDRRYFTVAQSEPPTVDLNSPSDGATIGYAEGTTGADVNHQFNFSTQEDSANVSVYINGTEEYNTSWTLGNSTSLNYSKLQTNGTYEWYVEIDTADHTVTSSNRTYTVEEVSGEPITNLDVPADGAVIEYKSEETFRFTHETFSNESRDITLFVEKPDDTVVFTNNFGNQPSDSTQTYSTTIDQIELTDTPGDYDWYVYSTYGSQDLKHFSNGRSFTISNPDPPTITLNNPADNEEFFYTEGTSGTSVNHEWSFDTAENSATTRLYVNGKNVFSTTWNSGDTQNFNYSKLQTEGVYEWYVEVETDTYTEQSVNRTYTVTETNETVPTVDFTEPVGDKEPYFVPYNFTVNPDFNVTVNASVEYPNGYVQNIGSLPYCSLDACEYPGSFELNENESTIGDYSFDVDLESQNTGNVYTQSQPFSVNYTTGLDLVKPSDDKEFNVENTSVTNKTVNFTVDVNPVVDGTLELLVKEPNASNFTVERSEFVNISENKSYSVNFTNITYNETSTGSLVSGDYEWKFVLEDDFGATFESETRSFSFVAKSVGFFDSLYNSFTSFLGQTGLAILSFILIGLASYFTSKETDGGNATAIVGFVSASIFVVLGWIPIVEWLSGIPGLVLFLLTTLYVASKIGGAMSS